MRWIFMIIALCVLTAAAVPSLAQDDAVLVERAEGVQHTPDTKVTSIAVRPNPASEHVTVEVPAPAETAVTFRVITLDGRQLLRRQVLANESGIAQTTIERDREGMAPGQYHIAVATTNGRGSTTVTFRE